MDFSTYIKFSSNLTENQETTITYSGYLFKKNSSSLKIVYGFGSNWMYTKEQEMEKTENGFVANVKMLNFSDFNFCFKNPNNEWDNNFGKNFSAPISEYKVEEAFVLNENVIDDILTNLVQCDVSKVEKTVTPTATEVKTAVQEIKVTEELSNSTSSEKQTPLNNISIENFQNRIKVENYKNIYIDEPTNVVDSVVDNIVDDLANNSVHIEESVETPVDTIVNDMIDNLYENSQNIESNDVPFEETGLVVSPRTLGKFYSFKKKMKIALYRFFKSFPKLLSGNLNEDNN